MKGMPAAPNTTVAGHLNLAAFLSGPDPMLRKLILLLWVTSAVMSALFGVAAVELDWSTIPVRLDGHEFYVTVYPPLILGMFWLFWFGYWWAAIPTWATTFILATHYGMPWEWALLFACSDPLGLALIALVYWSLPDAMDIRRPGNILLFVLFSFAGAVLSSVGAFIWSHATQAEVTQLYPVWEGWWVGFMLQNLIIVLPILLLCDPLIRRWQNGTRLWRHYTPGRRALRQSLIIALMLVLTAIMFSWFSASLTEKAITTAAHSRDPYIWQPVAQMVKESIGALMTVLMILMAAITVFGIYLFRYWSERLTETHQSVLRSNRRLTAEIRQREKVQGELQERYHMLNLMAQLDSRLHAADSAHEVINALAEYLPRQLPRMEGVLCRMTPEWKLEILTHWGRHPLIGARFAAEIELTKDPAHWHSPYSYDPEGLHGIHRVLPLKSGHELAGAVLLGASADEDPAVEAVLQMLTEHLTLALTNLKLREKLVEEATHDPLTGLYNRRYLQDWLEKELVRSQRHGRALSLMMIDIDHFKVLNDTLGHAAGDRALQGLSHYISAQIRQSDVACRFGGEEIILVMPETSRDTAAMRAQQLCEGIRSLKLMADDGSLLPPMTVSIGLASYPDEGGTASALFRAADMAMYKAKSSGRNQVCCY
ncbi:GGDEF domain-containing protein [Marinobacterium sp. AK62]|uniref:diguanylate cyclase n=1 Tax=Marinobacterium alkalitolerans TaxID=1542925 RepID=A0ABS3Z6V5_9GAMM|nr:GGDEF domain-containing protein [Marinobacterium alkalitolerans]MBP0047424.1 GGDEF domain-containing protein [Marinobacterium alkalitolerans]